MWIEQNKSALVFHRRTQGQIWWPRPLMAYASNWPGPTRAQTVPSGASMNCWLPSQERQRLLAILTGPRRPWWRRWFR
jgi:hypothetical protein